MEYTKTIIELYPDDPRAYNNLGFYYQQQGQYEKAIEEYKTALRIDPYLMLTYSGLSWVYLDNLGQIDSARVWSEKMIEAGPENPWGYFYLGSTYVSIDNLERAEVEYLKARDLDPNMSLNLYRLGNVYRLQEKYETAIEVFEDILDRRPGDGDAHYNLGVIYNLLGDIENARIHFLEYKKTAEYWLDVSPDNPSSFIVNGLVLTL
jgi:tetratricopeptide (TPR) repeat protein